MDKKLILKKGEFFYRIGDEAKEFFILLKGKAVPCFNLKLTMEDFIEQSTKLPIFSAGSVLGVAEIFCDRIRRVDLVAVEDCEYISIYIGDSSMESLFFARPNYASLLAQALIYQGNSLYFFLQSLVKDVHALKTLAIGAAVHFLQFKQDIGLRLMPAGDFFTLSKDILAATEKSSKSFANASLNECLFNTAMLLSDELKIEDVDGLEYQYINSLGNIPVEILKSFLASDPYIALHNALPALKLVDYSLTNILDKLGEAFSYFNFLVKSDEGTLFSTLLMSNKEIIISAGDNSKIVKMLELIRQKSREVHDFWLQEYAIDLPFEDAIFKTAIKAAKVTKVDSSPSDMVVPDELKNSFFRLLQIADLPFSVADEFRIALDAFCELGDKSSQEQKAIEIRSLVTSGFFQLYMSILNKEIKSSDANLVRLFQVYGFVDERLVSPETMINLLSVDNVGGSGICQVFSLVDWLKKIYNMEREPSINEFEQDYQETFRQMKKRGEATESDYKNYNEDRQRRLEFEINNFAKSALKLCHGKLPIYVPILYEDLLQRDVNKCHVTVSKLNSAIVKLLDIDFSIFHREIFYHNEKNGINSEPIMRAIAPEIIILPIVGGRSSAWQSITGRDRKTPGRLVFPALSNESVDDLAQRALGYFRWELCRTMAGVSWNDIRIKSLTSQYIDYTQFYRKNQNLSVEAKEKLRLQLSRSRSPKDVFLEDYLIWINYEAKGSIRLNKVARGILFENVPLAANYREKLGNLPAFSEFNNHFEIRRKKKVKDLELKYFYYHKLPGGLPKELEENLFFYKEM